jgi:acetyltransferase
MKQFSHEFIARLTQLDYARAMAFVAFDEASNEVVGVVRIHSDSIYETGEYAILLRSDLKGRGLGWTLMQMIIEYAKSEGLKTIRATCCRKIRSCWRCATTWDSRSNPTRSSMRSAMSG